MSNLTADRVLQPGVNGLLGWPDSWTTRHHNACNEPCDMLIGPCACGAWHNAAEGWVRNALLFYGARIIGTSSPTPATSLSYF